MQGYHHHVVSAPSATDAMPLPSWLSCPAGCGIVAAVYCFLAEERRLRVDLIIAIRTGSRDVEVLRRDVAAAAHRVDLLLAFGREAVAA